MAVGSTCDVEAAKPLNRKVGDKRRPPILMLFNKWTVLKACV